jgi:hypothetical protein
MQWRQLDFLEQLLTVGHIPKQKVVRVELFR